MGERVINLHSARSGSRATEDIAISRWRNRFQHLLDLSRDGFVETDGDGVLTEWNRQAELMFGWSRDEVIGRAVTDFLIPERYLGRYRHDLEAARTSVTGMERTRPREMQLMHREGNEIRVTGAAYVIGTGDDLRIGGFVRDLEEERAAEEALAHAYLHDSLTGLPNRTLFTYRLAYALAKGTSAPGIGGGAGARPRPVQGDQRRTWS